MQWPTENHMSIRRRKSAVRNPDSRPFRWIRTRSDPKL